MRPIRMPAATTNATGPIRSTVLNAPPPSHGVTVLVVFCCPSAINTHATGAMRIPAIRLPRCRMARTVPFPPGSGTGQSRCRTRGEGRQNVHGNTLSAMTAGEVLWRPPADVLERSRIGDYLRWLADVRGLEFDGDYQALWRWSVDDLPAFWRSIWDYFEVITHEPATDVLIDDRMPGAVWF